MIQRAPLLATLLSLLVTASATSTAAIIVNKYNGPQGINIPGDLQYADRFHIVFRSSVARDASGTSVSDYDAFIQGLATTADLGDGWRAIVSTADVDAYDHLDVLFSDLDNVPIYDQTGTRIEDSFNGLWDGGLLAPIHQTETGAVASNAFVFTGSDQSGRADSPYTLAPATCTGTRLIRTGDSRRTDSRWIDYQIEPCVQVYVYYYGLSPEYILPAPGSLLLTLPVLAWIGARFRAVRIGSRR